MLTFGRDYTLPAAQTRQREAGSEIPARNGDTLLGWPDYQQGRVALVFATLFAAPARRKLGEWDSQCYTTASQAYSLYSAQLDAYYRLAGDQPDKFRLIQAREDLEDLLAHWERQEQETHPVGLVLLMEGAEGVRAPGELDEWWERGVRLIGPAWAGNRFCGGTQEPGPLTSEGYALLDGMASAGFALDLSHMDERAALQALDYYPLAVIASHSNPASLLPGLESNRFLSDRQIRGLIERDGVVGIVPFNRFLLPDWKTGDSRQAVSLQHVAHHVDYICQVAGDALHVGIGSDFDGGFGLQSVPAEIDTIADLQKLAQILHEQGYTGSDVAAIMGENWLSLLRRTLPGSQ